MVNPREYRPAGIWDSHAPADLRDQHQINLSFAHALEAQAQIQAHAQTNILDRIDQAIARLVAAMDSEAMVRVFELSPLDVNAQQWMQADDAAHVWQLKRIVACGKLGATGISQVTLTGLFPGESALTFNVPAGDLTAYAVEMPLQNISNATIAIAGGTGIFTVGLVLSVRGR